MHQKSNVTKLNLKGVESFNSLDTNNGRYQILHLNQVSEYAGLDLSGVAKPAVLILSDNSEFEVLCILDEAEECHPETYVYYVFPQAENRYEIFACLYCGVQGNPCSVVITPKGTSPNCPCVSCHTTISDMIQQPDFVYPEGCHSHEESYEQILEDIRANSEYWTWDKYFYKL